MRCGENTRGSAWLEAYGVALIAAINARGNEREVVEFMFTRLAGEQSRRLATMGFLFVALSFFVGQGVIKIKKAKNNYA